MRVRDRVALAWRGYWAEMHEEFRQLWLQTREDHQELLAAIREQRQWDLMLRRKITGLDNPTRRDVRRAIRDYDKQQRRERR